MSDVHPVCTRFHAAIELIGAKWSGAVLQALFTGSHRFADIRAAIPGVSDMMLTRRLRELEAGGLVERRVIPLSPVHVEYHLTQMGREAGPVLEAVIAWSHKWIPLPADATDDTASHLGGPEAVAASQGTGRSGGSVVQ
jgi:DNA-binding HxlR family transcriptional regulator